VHKHDTHPRTPAAHTHAHTHALCEDARHTHARCVHTCLGSEHLVHDLLTGSRWRHVEGRRRRAWGRRRRRLCGPAGIEGSTKGETGATHRCIDRAGAWTGRAYSPPRRQWHVAPASDLRPLERARCPDVPPSQIREREVGRPAERQRDTDWLSVRATNAGPAAHHSETMRGAARRQAHRPVAESAVLGVARRAAVSDEGSGREVSPAADEARAEGSCHAPAGDVRDRA
jgi:hypothetical protein